MMDIVKKLINEIKPYPHNPRRNTDTIDKVKISIKKYGFNQPIVVDKSMSIVVGHTRYAAARELGLTEVPVVIADLDEKQARAYRIMDNKAHDFTKWDVVDLKKEIESLPNVEATGFRLKELDDILFPELGLIGKDHQHNRKHHIIVQCDSREDMDQVETQIKQKGFKKCRQSWF
jgi:site-specific DNA-methyltransferase (adenine-specific)